jgi:hypothetical protein
MLNIATEENMALTYSSTNTSEGIGTNLILNKHTLKTECPLTNERIPLTHNKFQC